MEVSDEQWKQLLYDQLFPPKNPLWFDKDKEFIKLIYYLSLNNTITNTDKLYYLQQLISKRVRNGNYPLYSDKYVYHVGGTNTNAIRYTIKYFLLQLFKNSINSCNKQFLEYLIFHIESQFQHRGQQIYLIDSGLQYLTANINFREYKEIEEHMSNITILEKYYIEIVNNKVNMCITKL